MVKIVPLLLLVAATQSQATRINFINSCQNTVQLWDNQNLVPIQPGGSTSRDVSGTAMFRDGIPDQATLAEFTIAGGKAWYDIGTIIPGSGGCGSVKECESVTGGKTGFNRPLAIIPQDYQNKGPVYEKSCVPVQCTTKDCEDAYKFPADNTKTKSCPDTTVFDVTFCPREGGGVNVQAPPTTPPPVAAASVPTPEPTFGTPSQDSVSGRLGFSVAKPNTTLGDQQGYVANVQAAPVGGNSYQGQFNVRSSFKYSGELVGNYPGTYDMVVNPNGCQKQTQSVNSPVGPMSEEVTMVFRGPMEIFDIAVFDGSSGGNWNKVSTYSRKNKVSDNMVFMNNNNIDYSGSGKSPQGFSGADGFSVAGQPTFFAGSLAEAKNPSAGFGGPGIKTGAEVNIMTSKPCAGDCKGYADERGYHGWGGADKMFVTKVQMPQGGIPNQPAIWMLNAQVVRSNQYGCNCRGFGAAGGCGELDVAEVIETNQNRDRVSTHYYFYGGKNAGYDNFAPRPTNAPTNYLTIFHSSGVVKILEVDDFDFSSGSIPASQISQWLGL